MTPDKSNSRVDAERGYQPKTTKPIRIENLKLPKGGSAIVRPNPPAARK
jgi:hypothetical protein